MKLLLATLLCLQGCSAFTVHNTAQATQPDLSISVQFDDPVTYKGKEVYAKALWNNGVCTITINPSKYTHSCLGHELRHCLEGMWHGSDNVAC